MMMYILLLLSTLFVMSLEIDKLWCLQYDQDSYYHSLHQIKFRKYLSNILSNPHFPSFQKQAAKELKTESDWNERSWLTIQFFEYLNNAFEFKKFQKKLVFIAQKGLRKTFGCFRMWIDLERLYLLFFLKMDKIEFQEDRLFFSYYRTLFFLAELLTNYEVEEFDYEFIYEIAHQVKQKCQEISVVTPTYFRKLLETLGKILERYLMKETLIDEKDKDEFKKQILQKLLREYDISNQVEERLKQNVAFQDRFREISHLESIFDSPEIKQKLETANKIFDPRIRIISEYKEQCRKQKIEFEQEKLEKLLEEYQLKMKSKPISEPYYQTIMKSGHNPYDDNNYTIYGETLNVDMNKKDNLKIEVEEVEEVEQEDVENHSYMYTTEFLEKAEKLTSSSAAVTNFDLNTNFSQGQLKNNNNRPFKSNRSFTHIKWQKFKDEEERKKMSELVVHSTMHSLNENKKLENNVIFGNEDEEEEMSKKIMVMKNMHRGLQSDVLAAFEAKSKQLYLKRDSCDPKKIDLNVNGKFIVSKNQFDKLRKMLQLIAVEQKLKKWINMEEVAAFYPRNIDQIREYPSDPTINRKKKALALDQILF